MKTITLPVSELKGVQLDWAFAMACGAVLEYLRIHPDNFVFEKGESFPKIWETKPHITLDFIYREKISVYETETPKNKWLAESHTKVSSIPSDTPLIAIARCYIASKLGESVEVPVLGDE